MKLVLLSVLIACSSTSDELQKIYDATYDGTRTNPTAVMKVDGKTLIIEAASKRDCDDAMFFWGWRRTDALRKEGIKLIVCGEQRATIE